MSALFDQKKQRLGALYGLVGGVVFSITAWGLDGIALANSHVSYPFIKFIPGLVISAIVGSLVGWLSIKIGRLLVTIVLWLMFALVLVWMIIWIPFTSTPTLIKLLQPSLTEWIDYPIVANVEQFRIVGLIIIAVAALICGIMEMNSVEAGLMSSHKVAAVLPIILICSLLMGLAGFACDEITSRHFREPIQSLDNLFQFAIDNQGKEIDEKVARRMHLSTVKDLEEILPRSRKLTLIAFDQALGQMDILVNFEGLWVKCTTIYSQPTMCEPVLHEPVNYFLSPRNHVPIRFK